MIHGFLLLPNNILYTNTVLIFNKNMATPYQYRHSLPLLFRSIERPARYFNSIVYLIRELVPSSTMYSAREKEAKCDKLEK